MMIMFGGGRCPVCLADSGCSRLRPDAARVRRRRRPRRRSARDRAADRRRLGLRVAQSRQHSGRQRRRADARASSAWSTRASRASPTTGARCARGRGARRAGSTISRPTRAVDAKKVGIEGVSRYGKAALVTMAFDHALRRRADRIVRRRRRQAAPPQLRRSGREPHRLGRIPLDGRQLPEVRRGRGDVRQQERRRPSGRRARADRALRAAARRSSATACPRRATRSGSTSRAASWPPIAAQPVFRLLGAKDLGRSDDYMTEKMPAVNVGLLDGELAWRQHDGGHTDGPNWKYFIPWADSSSSARRGRGSGA